MCLELRRVVKIESDMTMSAEVRFRQLISRLIYRWRSENHGSFVLRNDIRKVSIIVYNGFKIENICQGAIFCHRFHSISQAFEKMGSFCKKDIFCLLANIITTIGGNHQKLLVYSKRNFLSTIQGHKKR